ncbi:nucleoside-diphosphate-sugar epimerase [Klebsiella pneumoniae]|nr:nucleoside-diphosphate-sugar epimerase [Klebsiella pneumoniae]
MRIFLTGASGFIGSRILPALQASGHQVIGLARSESTAQALKAAGAEVHRGTLDAPESLLAGVGNADAVIHTAFDHDFSRFAANCEKDRQAILALGQALRGSTRPLVITSGTLMGDDGSGAPALVVLQLRAPQPAHRLRARRPAVAGGGSGCQGGPLTAGA